jgi:hypothetical protein
MDVAYIHETVVRLYLTTKRSVFVNPQYLLGTPINYIEIDFLALDFLKQQAWMVEVTSAPRLEGKMSKFEIVYAPKIRDQLTQHRVIPAGGWAIGLWLFVPQSEVLEQERLMLKHGIQLRCATALEDMWPVRYWSERFV